MKFFYFIFYVRCPFSVPSISPSSFCWGNGNPENFFLFNFNTISQKYSKKQHQNNNKIQIFIRFFFLFIAENSNNISFLFFKIYIICFFYICGHYRWAFNKWMFKIPELFIVCTRTKFKRKNILNWTLTTTTTTTTPRKK